jgi:sulfoxide reductase heme-binding subunit YedZ
MHLVTIVVDPYAGVGLSGALLPGLSSYRSAPVALGTIALYALLVTGITARWTRLLPPGAWIVIHRGAIAIFAVAWMHGLLAGTDSAPLMALYVGLGLAILAAAAHRLWARTGHLEEVVS